MSEFRLVRPQITGVDLVADLQEFCEACWDCIEQMLELGRDKAEAERAYRVAKRQRILYERNRNGTPVSIIESIVKGYEDIAELSLNLTIAEEQYKANYEALLFYKKQIDALREQISREWGREYPE